MYKKKCLYLSLTCIHVTIACCNYTVKADTLVTLTEPPAQETLSEPSGLEGLSLGPAPGADKASGATGITLEGFDGVWLETAVRRFLQRSKALMKFF